MQLKNYNAINIPVVMLHVDVPVNKLNVDINKAHVNIIMLHFEISANQHNYLACPGTHK